MTVTLHVLDINYITTCIIITRGQQQGHNIPPL